VQILLEGASAGHAFRGLFGPVTAADEPCTYDRTLGVACALVDLPARRFDAVLADRPPNCSE
jgi:hypothetical protein